MGHNCFNMAVFTRSNRLPRLPAVPAKQNPIPPESRKQRQGLSRPKTGSHIASITRPEGREQMIQTLLRGRDDFCNLLFVLSGTRDLPRSRLPDQLPQSPHRSSSQPSTGLQRPCGGAHNSLVVVLNQGWELPSPTRPSGHATSLCIPWNLSACRVFASCIQPRGAIALTILTY